MHWKKQGEILRKQDYVEIYVECESRLPFVQAYMGHSDVRTTMSYVSTDTKKLKASLEDSNLRLIGA